MPWILAICSLIYSELQLENFGVPLLNKLTNHVRLVAAEDILPLWQAACMGLSIAVVAFEGYPKLPGYYHPALSESNSPPSTCHCVFGQEPPPAQDGPAPARLWLGGRTLGWEAWHSQEPHADEGNLQSNAITALPVRWEVAEVLLQEARRGEAQYCAWSFPLY
jgi:hypothetical protein